MPATATIEPKNPGIIQSALNKDIKVSGYTPERVEVDPNKDLVQGRVKGIIDENSPLMRQAETRALQTMNQRGIINSSMAVGAGQSALYDAALPIASQDAQTSFTAKRANQDAGNTALQFNAGSQNQFASQQLTGKQNLEQIGAQTDAASRLQAEKAQIDKDLMTADAATKERLMNRQAEIDTQMQQLRGTQSKELAELENQNRLDLTQIENQNRTLLQTSQMAGQLYSTTQEAISQILANPDIPVEQKTALVNRQKELLSAGLGVVGGIGNLDLGGLLNFGTSPGAPGTPNTPGSETVSIGGKTYDTLLVSGVRDLVKSIQGGGIFKMGDELKELERMIKNSEITVSDIANIAGKDFTKSDYWGWISKLSKFEK